MSSKRKQKGEEAALKNWLCKPHTRKGDCIIITERSGLATQKSTEYNGIETDIVLHVVKSCRHCTGSSISPIAITRAKALLVVAKYQPPKCSLCEIKQRRMTV